MTTLEILIAARDWLAVGPDRWCQGFFAINRRGRALFAPHAKSCVAASSLGAVHRFSLQGVERRHAVKALEIAIGGGSIPEWDYSLPPGRAGWEQVLAAFSMAIEAKRARADD